MEKLTICLFLVTAFTFTQAWGYSGGTGTPEDPYQIATAADLILLGETPEDYDKHFIMIADIDLDPNLPGGRVFDRAVIAADAGPGQEHQGTPFGGVFDGKEHRILNLTIAGVRYLGLFGSVGGSGIVSNLSLEQVNVAAATGWVEVGGGKYRHESRYIGALVGANSGHLSSCYATGIIRGEVYVGGLVGVNRDTVADCYTTVTVSATEHTVGGLAGWNSGSIATSYSTGMVNGDRCVGGLVAANHGDITGCRSTGMVSGDSYVGGLAGRNSSNIIESYSGSTIRGETAVGGLVGWNRDSVAMSYSTGSVSGRDRVGGLAGDNDGSIASSYSTGMVSGEVTVGGLVGLNTGGIAMSYSVGIVSGDKEVGGFVAHDETLREGAWRPSHGTTTTSFWNSETSGQTTSAGGTGLLTSEMQIAATFLNVGWDFISETENGPNDIWKIVEGQTYPLLSWQKYGGGTGDPNDPYLLYTAEHLNALGAEPNDYDRHFKLMSDIDLSGYVYDRAVIAPDVNDLQDGFQGIEFSGAFDGGGHTISHVTVTGRDYLGFFGLLNGRGEISNLRLETMDVNGIGFYAGGLVSRNAGAITACCGSGTVRGRNCVGGLLGNNEGSIVNCRSISRIAGDNWVGGPVGNNYGSVSNCDTTCTVNGTGGDIGGLVGGNFSEITECNSTATVSGRSSVGGIAGTNSQGNINNCCSRGTINGETAVGGLAGGNSYGYITASYSTATTSWSSEVGGLVGKNSHHGTITNCYSRGSVSGRHFVGGGAGRNYAGPWGLSVPKWGPSQTAIR